MDRVSIGHPILNSFLKYYLDTKDEERILEVTEKASLIGYSRLIRKFRKKGTVSDEDKEKISICVNRISEIANRLTTLAF